MHYTCGDGHWISTPDPKVLDRCPLAICTRPWLTAEGDGSRAENARLKRYRIELQNQANERLFG